MQTRIFLVANQEGSPRRRTCCFSILFIFFLSLFFFFSSDCCYCRCCCCCSCCCIFYQRREKCSCTTYGQLTRSAIYKCRSTPISILGLVFNAKHTTFCLVVLITGAGNSPRTTKDHRGPPKTTKDHQGGLKSPEKLQKERSRRHRKQEFKKTPFFV